MRRRTFLYTGAIAIGTPLAGCRPWMKRDLAPEPASDHQVDTIGAMAATFIPSAAGSPGAIESGALDTILDPAHPVVGYLSELVTDLDDWCFVRHFGNRFVDLSPAGREQALEERMGVRGLLIQSWYRPVYEGVLALTKLSFFGGLTHAIGTTFTEFPGASAGYAAHSAAGVHRASGATVVVAGPGQVSSVRVTAMTDGKPPHPLRMRLDGPDGRHHELTVAAGAMPTVVVDDHTVTTAAGGPAAGTWRLSTTTGAITAWWLSLRTDLDEPT